MRNHLLAASLTVAGLMFVGTPARTHPIPAATQSEQQPQPMKSVDGTVSSIGDNGRSFALEVNESGNKRTVQFVMDKDTKVQGQLKVGTPVTVEYVAMAD